MQISTATTLAMSVGCCLGTAYESGPFGSKVTKEVSLDLLIIVFVNDAVRDQLLQDLDDVILTGPENSFVVHLGSSDLASKNGNITGIDGADLVRSDGVLWRALDFVLPKIWMLASQFVDHMLVHIVEIQRPMLVVAPPWNLHDNV
jgi:hypothetical protein